MVKGKKGWIQVVEAFTALLIILGVVLVIIGEDRILKVDSSKEIYEKEVAIITEIQLNNSLRNEILTTPQIPINSEEQNFPSGIKNLILNKIPENLNCVGNICELDSTCLLTGDLERYDIYVQSGIIFVEGENYNPKQIKLFCWED